MNDRKTAVSRKTCVGGWICLLMAFVVICGRAAADMYPRQTGISVQKYSFDVTLSDTSDELSVSDTIAVRFTADGTRGIDLDLCNPISEPRADRLDPCL